jgi:hypothetical protein
MNPKQTFERRELGLSLGRNPEIGKLVWIEACTPQRLGKVLSDSNGHSSPKLHPEELRCRNYSHAIALIGTQPTNRPAVKDFPKGRCRQAVDNIKDTFKNNLPAIDLPRIEVALTRDISDWRGEGFSCGLVEHPDTLPITVNTEVSQEGLWNVVVLPGLIRHCGEFSTPSNYY